MDPERTKLTAPERIYLGYTSFWYETSEEGLHDIEYVRADLLATVRAEVFKEAAEIVARLPVHINRSGVKKGSDLNGWASAINEAVKALEAAENRKEEG